MDDLAPTIFIEQKWFSTTIFTEQKWFSHNWIYQVHLSSCQHPNWDLCIHSQQIRTHNYQITKWQPQFQQQIEMFMKIDNNGLYLNPGMVDEGSWYNPSVVPSTSTWTPPAGVLSPSCPPPCLPMELRAVFKPDRRLLEGALLDIIRTLEEK
jgi:hypothetical protein